MFFFLFFSSKVIELMTEEFTEMNVFMGSDCESVERRCVPFYQCFQFLKCIFGASSRLEPLIFFFFYVLIFSMRLADLLISRIFGILNM